MGRFTRAIILCIIVSVGKLGRRFVNVRARNSRLTVYSFSTNACASSVIHSFHEARAMRSNEWRVQLVQKHDRPVTRPLEVGDPFGRKYVPLLPSEICRNRNGMAGAWDKKLGAPNEERRSIENAISSIRTSTNGRIRP